MMNETLAIQLDGVEQSRSNFKLGPLHMSIPKGYITAIVGPNGCGKSSTFRLMLDLDKADKGTIELLGCNVNQGMDTELKKRIGYLHDQSSSHENNMIGAAKAEFHRFWYDDWDINRYRELLHILEVEDHLMLGKMSKGMRRKFEFALALAHGPELLLLDEPSSGLDPLAWKTMIEVLHRYMDRGDRTILMTSHIIEEVKRLADYIVFMAQGRVLGMYEKDELFSSWFTLFVSGAELTAKKAAELPGQCGVEHAGATTFRITTNKAAEAEEWCAAEGYQIVSRQALELDEIMSALLQQDRLHSRRN
ncbi:ABC-2 type transport system ATP-binding protein [Paenibacillus endophyticus]|uniref:ABC-2 type transport system ATP-binding protein n=2 Tax=Paenibacillus endophyticus TaxID=1294268 RepID=A0A7W5CCD1_9BACL|nr:ATP-binding cassette domain-containing protein [Paenibacillus endophyticus]MBB3155118.1 ABC-2 type transport system ATP-binding protein [Paenibacillus endophyticus]